LYYDSLLFFNIHVPETPYYITFLKGLCDVWCLHHISRFPMAEDMPCFCSEYCLCARNNFIYHLFGTSLVRSMFTPALRQVDASSLQGRMDPGRIFLTWNAWNTFFMRSFRTRHRPLSTSISLVRRLCNCHDNILLCRMKGCYYSTHFWQLPEGVFTLY